MSINFAISTAYWKSEGNQLYNYDRWKTPRNYTKQYKYNIPRLFISIILKQVETSPSKPPLVDLVAKRCLKILIHIVSKNWVTATGFINVIAYQNSWAYIFWLWPSSCTLVRTNNIKLWRSEGFNVIHIFDFLSLMINTLMITLCWMQFAKEWGKVQYYYLHMMFQSKTSSTVWSFSYCYNLRSSFVEIFKI